MYEQDQKQENNRTNSIQRELENQLRSFGAVATDSVLNGIDGKGEVLGSAAKGVGLAFADFVQDELKRAAQASKETATQYYTTATANARKKQKNTMMLSRASSRFGVGVAQCLFGGFLGGSFALAGFICVVVALAATLDATAFMATAIVGGSLLLASIPFFVMLAFGMKNTGISKRMKRYASIMGEDDKVSFDQLAKAAGCDEEQVRKDFKDIVKNNWAQVWLDEMSKMVYLDSELYRTDCLTMANYAAAQAQKQQTEQAQKDAATQAAAAANFPLSSVENFIDVLGKQRTLMQDQQAKEELSKMQNTSRDIYEWVVAHPETAPRVRRLSNYYMPTTLKLLHAYNEVQGQQGENADSIRRDIAGILHTLNVSFTNLHDTLLSDVAMDISSEIAALQGMLAQDGLSDESNFDVN